MLIPSGIKTARLIRAFYCPAISALILATWAKMISSGSPHAGRPLNLNVHSTTLEPGINQEQKLMSKGADIKKEVKKKPAKTMKEKKAEKKVKKETKG